MRAIQGFFRRDWSMAEKILFTAACVLFGMVWGFLWSPATRGFTIGSHNGHRYMSEDELDWEDEE